MNNRKEWSNERGISPFPQLKERYRNHPEFRQMVDQLLYAFTTAQIHPYEVKDAAFLAELIYRETHVEPFVMTLNPANARD